MAQTSSLRVDQIGLAQSLANARLGLFLMGETHRLLLRTQEEALAPLVGLRQGEPLSAGAASEVQVQALRAWATFITDYTDMLKRAVKQAAALPFGALAHYHERLILPAVASVQEAAPSPFALDPMYDEAVQAALTRRYSDGLALSERIWQLDRRGRKRIGSILLRGVQEQRSIRAISLDLQQFMGARPGCRGQVRRWLGYRASRVLLRFTGGRCSGTGISWEASRLAMNEALVAMNIANDILLARMPFIQGEQISLASTHGEEDECDAVATGGAKGDGAYPVGTVELPIHVLCRCIKTAVLKTPTTIGQEVRRYIALSEATGGGFEAYRAYVRLIGGDLSASLLSLPLGGSLELWYAGGETALEARFWLQDAEEPIAEAMA
jgi:hypothetical protein